MYGQNVANTSSGQEYCGQSAFLADIRDAKAHLEVIQCQPVVAAASSTSEAEVNSGVQVAGANWKPAARYQSKKGAGR